MASKYKEIASALRADIEDSVYPPNTLLPTEQQLCETFGASRQTVRMALKCLVEDGLIERRQGSGSHVLSKNMEKSVPQRTIAIITTYISDYILPSILREAEAVLSANNCKTLLYATSDHLATERKILLDLLQEKKLDGMLVQGTKSALPNPNLDLYHKLQQKNIPIVFFNAHYPDLEHTIAVMDDNFNGGYLLTKYLASKKHTKIAGIFKSDDIQGPQRYAGYLTALRDLRLPMMDDHIFWYRTEDKAHLVPDSYLWTEVIKPLLKGCSAVVCYNDEIASSLIQCLLQSKISIPEQMAVVSFDDSVFSYLSACKITSLSHDKYNVGNVAAQMLIAQLNGKDVQSKEVPWVLMEKESS